MRKSSYKTNSWWHHRMVGSLGPDRDIRTFEDKCQDAYLKKLEESKRPPGKKIEIHKSRILKKFPSDKVTKKAV